MAPASHDAFQPGRLAGLELPNRILKAATFEGMSPDGIPGERLRDFHVRTARGGVAMTTLAYCTTEADGRINLLVPPYGRGRWGKKLQTWFRASSHRVRLDDIGSFVWQQCDGRNRVRDIAAAMHEHFGERVQPVEERLVLFLTQLVRGRFVSLDETEAALS